MKATEKQKQRMKKYYQNNKEMFSSKYKEYYNINKNILKSKQKEYRDKNRNILLQKKKKKYWKNRELYIQRMKENWKKNRLNYLEKGKIRSRIWYKNNRNHVLNRIYKYEKNRKLIDFEYKLRKNLRRRLRACLKAFGNGKKFKSDKYGINYNAIIEHLKPFPKDISKYHVDHIKPLCSFNLTNPKQIKLAFAPKNHQWLLAEQNLRKGSK